MRAVKQYILSLAAVLLLVLLAELIAYPLSPSRIAEEANAKTTGAMLFLTDETPQKVEIYHRAVILPRYRLDRVLDITEEDFWTANVDWFQSYAVHVENHQLTLHGTKNNGRIFNWLIPFFLFVSGVYTTGNLIRQKALGSSPK